MQLKPKGDLKMTTLAQNKNFTIRLDAKVKEEAESLFADLGMTLSCAMNIFLRQALIVRGLPFEVRQERPNKVTLAAMEEAIRIANDPNVRRFATVDELMKDLDK